MSTAMTETRPAAGAGTVAVPNEDAVTSDDFLLRLVSDPNIDPSRLAAMMDIIERRQEERRRDRAEAARIAFKSAKARMQAELPTIGRDTPNSQTGSRYARLETIWDICMPVWTEHGFSVAFDVNSLDNGLIRVRLILDHEAGHTEVFTAPDTPPDIAGPKGAATKTVVQGNQSTVTYVKRGLLCNALGIVTRYEDDDGNSARKPDQPAKPGKQSQPASRDRGGEKPSKPSAWVANRLALLATINDGGAWLSALVNATVNATTIADIEALAEAVADALSAAPIEPRSTAETAFAAARRRLTAQDEAAGEPRQQGEPRHGRWELITLDGVVTDCGTAVRFAAGFKLAYEGCQIDYDELVELNRQTIIAARAADERARRILDGVIPLHHGLNGERRENSTGTSDSGESEAHTAPETDEQWVARTKETLLGLKANADGRKAFMAMIEKGSDTWKRMIRFSKEKKDLYDDAMATFRATQARLQ